MTIRFQGLCCAQPIPRCLLLKMTVDAYVNHLKWKIEEISVTCESIFFGKESVVFQGLFELVELTVVKAMQNTNLRWGYLPLISEGFLDDSDIMYGKIKITTASKLSSLGSKRNCLFLLLLFIYFALISGGP